jgi:hypothetical protein
MMPSGIGSYRFTLSSDGDLVVLSSGAVSVTNETENETPIGFVATVQNPKDDGPMMGTVAWKLYAGTVPDASRVVATGSDMVKLTRSQSRDYEVDVSFWLPELNFVHLIEVVVTSDATPTMRSYAYINPVGNNEGPRSFETPHITQVGIENGDTLSACLATAAPDAYPALAGVESTQGAFKFMLGGHNVSYVPFTGVQKFSVPLRNDGVVVNPFTVAMHAGAMTLDMVDVSNVCVDAPELCTADVMVQTDTNAERSNSSPQTILLVAILCATLVMIVVVVVVLIRARNKPTI